LIADNYKYSDITEKIIEAFYKGYNTLGYGFLEKVYENALFKRNVFQTRKILFNHNYQRHQRSIFDC